MGEKKKKREGKVLRVLPSGRCLPRNQAVAARRYPTLDEFFEMKAYIANEEFSNDFLIFDFILFIGLAFTGYLSCNRNLILNIMKARWITILTSFPTLTIGYLI